MTEEHLQRLMRWPDEVSTEELVERLESAGLIVEDLEDGDGQVVVMEEDED